MKVKPRVIIGGVVLVACIVLTSIGFNNFVQAIGYIAAGFLFGQQPQPKE